MCWGWQVRWLEGGRGGTQNALFGMMESLVSATSKGKEGSLGTQNMVLVGNP